MSSRLAVLAACAALAFAGAAAAEAPPGISLQVGPTTDPAKPYVGWTAGPDGAPRYAPAGVVLPATVAGGKPAELKDLDPKGANAVVPYGEPADGATWATVYVYQPGVADLNLLALQADLAAREFSGLPAARIETVGPAGGPATALRVIYPPHQGQTQGLLLARAGRWVVKVRATGPAETPQTVAAALDEVLAGARWDAGGFQPAVPSAALPACPAEPKRKPAKPARLDTTETLIALVGAAVPAAKAEAEPPLDLADACLVPGTFNRATPLSILHFRDAETGKRARTLVLLGDAGAALDIGPALDLDGGKPKYTLGLRERGGAVALKGAFKDWPTDEQILDMFR